ncbi:MAG: diguanylate cyclase [Sedimenticola sp.]
MNSAANSLLGIVLRTPLLRGVMALVLAGAIVLPAYDLHYVYPAFERLLIKAMENDAKRTARHILHMLIEPESEEKLFSRDGLTDERQAILQDVVSDFTLWKARVFTSDGEIIFSTTGDEIGTWNENAYFHRKVTNGEVFSLVEQKAGKTMEGETAPVDIVEIYVPVIKDGDFKGAFEVYYDISEEWTMLESLLGNTGAILLLLIVGIVVGATVLVIKTAKEHQQLTKTQTALKKQERMFHDVLNAAQDAIVVTDSEQRIQMVNPAYTELTGFHQEEILGKTPAIMKSGRHDDAFYRDMWQTLIEKKHWRGEIWNRRKDGSVFPGLLSISTIDSDADDGVQYVGIYIDISKQKVQEERYQKMAFYDPLTNLPNRVLFMDRLGKAVQAAERDNQSVGVLFLDLDDFKRVNDRYGHLAGDALLQEIADRISHVVRREDTAARLGGDEFMLIVQGATGRATFERIATDVIHSISQPVTLAEAPESVHVGTSIGISVFGQDSHDIDELVRFADLAMYQAKRSGKNRHLFYADTLE